MTTLAELEKRRAYECRLTPDRALETLDDAEEFLCDRGLLTRTGDSALPSLFEACHEEPYARDSPGFGQWPATKFPWFGRLGARGYLTLAVHRGKSLLVTDEIAAVLDPICRAELARMEEAEEEWGRLLRHLADAGPSELEDLQTELALTSKDLKGLRAPLERCGAVVARSIVYEEPHSGAGSVAGQAGDARTGTPRLLRRHRHTSVLARWDQAHPKPSGAIDPRQAFGNLLCAGVRAAVVAPERELARWFSWRWYWDDSLVDELAAAGRLTRVDGHVATG